MERNVRIAILVTLIIAALVQIVYEYLDERTESATDLPIYGRENILVYSSGIHVFEQPRGNIGEFPISISGVLPQDIRIFQNNWELDGKIADTSARRICSLSGHGAVVCWAESSELEVEIEVTSASKVNTTTESIFTAVGVGGNHSCAILESSRGASELYCWGSNSLGQLGVNSTNPVDSNNPALVGLGNWTLLSLGNTHTCGVSNAHDLYCWGDGTLGQLGLGSQQSSLSPALVKTSESRIIDLDSGGYHTCALYEDGDLECWGWNGHGQIGTGNYEDIYLPQKVELDSTSEKLQISLGESHSCIMSYDSEISCWGDNRNGQIAKSGEPNFATPTLNNLFSGQVSSISTSNNRTCAIIESIRAICSEPDASNATVGVEMSQTPYRLLPISNRICWVSVTGEFGCSDYSGPQSPPLLPIGITSIKIPQYIPMGTLAGIPEHDFLGSFIVNDASGMEVGRFSLEVNFSSDSDSDGWPDSEEIRCNSDPTNNSARPPDTDGDSICNRFDWDDDGDGFPDTIDRFPQDDSEWRDDDRDGIGKNSEVFEISPGMRNSAFTVSILFTLLIIEFISIREGYNLQDSLPNIFHGEE